MSGWVDPDPKPLEVYRKRIIDISRGLQCRACGERFHNMNTVLEMRFCHPCMVKLDDLAEEFKMSRDEMAGHFIQVFGGNP